LLIAARIVAGSLSAIVPSSNVLTTSFKSFASTGALDDFNAKVNLASYR
jgi:hypothetical protein